MKALDEILVMIPTGDERMPSVAVCSVGDLVRELESHDALEEAIEDSAIDSPAHLSSAKQLPEIDGILFRMRKSNAAPDFCYWEPV